MALVNKYGKPGLVRAKFKKKVINFLYDEAGKLILLP